MKIFSQICFSKSFSPNPTNGLRFYDGLLPCCEHQDVQRQAWVKGKIKRVACSAQNIGLESVYIKVFTLTLLYSHAALYKFSSLGLCSSQL